MPKKSKKVKSLPAKSLSAKQAKGVKGGIIAVSQLKPGDGSVLKQTPADLKALNFNKI